jgi:L-threonylcarbamoyladenylate synthase
LGIFAAKGRPGNNPLIVHVADQADAVSLSASWPDGARKLADRFWPGPLTLVVPAGPRIPHTVTAGGTTVGLRVPAHPVAQLLLRETGLPLAAPSANRSSSLSPTHAEHVLAGLNGRIAMILNAGPTPGGLESTVLDLTQQPPVLLRPGLVTPLEIENSIGPIARQAVASPGKPLKSPGMLDRHYAPRAPLECVPGNGWERVRQLCAGGCRVGWLTFREPPGSMTMAGVCVLTMPDQPRLYGAQLFNALHVLDAAGVDRIVVEFPPAGDAWLAIHDRLQRAASAG